MSDPEQQSTASKPDAGKPSDGPGKMKAYAILAGGGVKGAALVGGLMAAEKYGIEFEGYGGASAGSVVALLASLGYSVEEMKDIILDTDFAQFLDDRSGKELDRVRQVGMRRFILKSWCVLGDGILIRRIWRKLGLYKGKNLEDFLLEKILFKHPYFNNQNSISFTDLRSRDCKSLKVIASDISQKKALIYSAARRDANESVLQAVRASISFPFVFEPMTLAKPRKRYVVDGGLISNLPVFLFANEQKRTGYPLVAFDLIPPTKDPNEKYRMKDFCSDLVATALEASDNLHRETISDHINNLFYIPIQVPPGIETLKFTLSRQERENLYRRGYIDTWNKLKEKLPYLPSAASPTQRIQATLNIRVAHLQSLLKALSDEVYAVTPVHNMRAHVMLPVSEKELMVTYQFNMDNDSDRELAVSTGSKWAREVFQNGKTILSDLEQLRSQPEEWGLKTEVVAKIKREQLTLISTPLREQRRGEQSPHGDSIGVLSLDTSTPLRDTMWWSKQEGDFTSNCLVKWATIISRVIT